MRRYHSTKTAKIFWVTLDVAMHGAAYGRPMRSPISVMSNISLFVNATRPTCDGFVALIKSLW